MKDQGLQLKYGLGIIHSVPWLDIGEGSADMHPVEPSIAALVQNVAEVTVEDEYTIPHESGVYKISVPAGKAATITERADQAAQMAKRIDVMLGEQSTVTYKIQTNGGTTVALRSFTCKKGSNLFVQESAVNADDLISHTQVVLADEGAAVEYASAFYGNDDAVIDTSQTIQHQASKTSSNLMSRGVLDGNAKGYYRASIEIAKGAKNCSGHQHEKTLLLSDNARMMAVPALEIANNDVSCSHAVATTHLSPEDLFYVQSRGIGETEARSAMIRAHLAPVLGACASDILTALGIDHE